MDCQRAKTWSTSAFAADYGLLLARTDPTVPNTMADYVFGLNHAPV